MMVVIMLTGLEGLLHFTCIWITCRVVIRMNSDSVGLDESDSVYLTGSPVRSMLLTHASLTVGNLVCFLIHCQSYVNLPFSSRLWDLVSLYLPKDQNNRGRSQGRSLLTIYSLTGLSLYSAVCPLWTFTSESGFQKGSEPSLAPLPLFQSEMFQSYCPLTVPWGI